MTSNYLPEDATYEHLTGTAAQRAEYLRKVVKNMDESGPDRERLVIRIGVAGQGISPHYRFERPLETTDIYSGATATFPVPHKIFNGLSHKEMTAFDVDRLRAEHWCRTGMTYTEVKAMLGRARAEARGQ